MFSSNGLRWEIEEYEGALLLHAYDKRGVGIGGTSRIRRRDEAFARRIIAETPVADVDFVVPAP